MTGTTSLPFFSFSVIGLGKKVVAENHAILGQQIAPPELDRSGHFLGLRISFRRLILGAGTAGSTQQNQGRKDQEQAHRFRPNPALHAASRSS